MTLEDVVLVIITIIPVWNLLMYLLFTHLPHAWEQAGEKYDRDERAREMAQAALEGRAPNIDVEEGVGEEEDAELVKIEGTAEEQAAATKMQAAARAKAARSPSTHSPTSENGEGAPAGSKPKSGVSFEGAPAAEKQTRPKRKAMPQPEALPAPGMCSCFTECLPKQLRPHAVAARAQSFFYREGASNIPKTASCGSGFGRS